MVVVVVMVIGLTPLSQTKGLNNHSQSYLDGVTLCATRVTVGYEWMVENIYTLEALF